MKPIILTLSQERFTGELTKIVKEDVLQKTFREAFDYMLDPTPDGTNPGYTALEGRTRDAIMEIKEAEKRNETEFALAYRSSEDTKPQKVNLDDRLNLYSDIVYETHSDNEIIQTDYKRIDLLCGTRRFMGWN